MTTLYVLGSGSAGNAVAIEAGGEVLLVDAGFSAREIRRRAAAAGLDLDGIVGVLLTHEHGDHASGAARTAKGFGVPVLTSPGTWAALAGRMETVEFLPLAPLAPRSHGAFTITACPTSHDAAEPIALSIETGSGHRVGVAYDLGRPTAAVRYLLRAAHALVLEANHDEILLRTSGYPPSVQERIAGSGGHLSNRAAAELLAEVGHPGLQAVVLAHLSERCNTEAHARAAVTPALAPLGIRLEIARQAIPLAPISLAPSAPSPGTPKGEREPSPFPPASAAVTPPLRVSADRGRAAPRSRRGAG